MFKKIMTMLTLVTVSMLPFIYGSCGSFEAKDDQEEPVTSVRLAPVVTERISTQVRTAGMLFAEAEMRLSFKIGGIVDEILVDEGQSVRAGQTLARLDLSEINAQVKQARSAFEKAERDLRRTRQLYEDTVATLEQLQNAETAFEVAKANLELAEFNLRHSEVTAPGDGVVLRRFSEENEVVKGGQPILMLGATGQNWVVRVGVSDRDVVRLRLADSARVQFDAYPEVVFDATVSEISEAADARSGTYQVELSVDNPGYKLASGFVAKVTITPAIDDEYPSIPVEAMVEADGKEALVFLPSPERDKAEARSVQIARLVGDRLAVRSGLENVDQVIVEGAQYLTDGAAIQVVE
jgi:RND family efflux transporter MFP subunit